MPDDKRASLIQLRLDFPAVWIALVAALLLKFFWPLFVFDVPLGYDPGFYRYLFIRHAEGLPPFIVADLEPWARGHPLGLFFFTSLLLKAGLPVDWLIGWMWNLFPVVLALTLALVVCARHGTAVALATLFAAFLSVAYFDGFASMYWKTFASLFWCVLTFYFLEKRSWWSMLTGILTVATHHQTGLLFGLTLGTWSVLPLFPFAQSTASGFNASFKKARSIVLPFIAGLCILVFGILWYLPVWEEAVTVHLPALIGQGTVASGSFPEPIFFVRTAGILLFLGIFGWGQSVMRERWTLWQIAAFWSAVFVVLRLLFYRRFFLQLDFFLLPFVGMAIVDIWKRFADYAIRSIIAALLIVQAVLSYNVLISRTPQLDAQTYNAIMQLPHDLPEEAFVLALENESVVILRGWLPYHRVGGPGLFDSTWSYQQWESFLLGSNQNRRELLSTLQPPVYVFVSPFFQSYYGDAMTQAITSDPCFEQTDHSSLYRITCIAP